MGALVAALILLMLAGVAVSGVIQIRIENTQSQLTGALRPAQLDAAGLGQASADQETAERGYLLTGDASVLADYQSASADAARYRQALGRDLADDPEAGRLLASFDEAATAWRTQSAEPEIAKAQHGALTGAGLVNSVMGSERRFQVVRTRLADLQEHVRQRTAAAVDANNSSQKLLSWLTLGGAIAAIALSLVAVVVLRYSLYRPLSRLVTSVRHVSAGHWDHSVPVTGPEEVATVASAVETMRLRILDDAAQSAAAQDQLARLEEGERIAFNLNDTVVAALFRTSLAVQSIASRHPAVADDLAITVADIDRIIRDLQAVASGMTARPEQGALSERVTEMIDGVTHGRDPAPGLRLAGALTEPISGAVVDEVVDLLRHVFRGTAGDTDPSTIEISLKIGRAHV